MRLIKSRWWWLDEGVAVHPSVTPDELKTAYGIWRRVMLVPICCDARRVIRFALFGFEITIRRAAPAEPDSSGPSSYRATMRLIRERRRLRKRGAGDPAAVARIAEITAELAELDRHHAR